MHTQVKVGDTIRIVAMDDPYAHNYIGKVGVVESINKDPWGDYQVWGTWGGVALYDGIDQFEIIETK